LSNRRWRSRRLRDEREVGLIDLRIDRDNAYCLAADKLIADDLHDGPTA